MKSRLDARLVSFVCPVLLRATSGKRKGAFLWWVKSFQLYSFFCMVIESNHKCDLEATEIAVFKCHKSYQSREIGKLAAVTRNSEGQLNRGPQKRTSEHEGSVHGSFSCLYWSTVRLCSFFIHSSQSSLVHKSSCMCSASVSPEESII